MKELFECENGHEVNIKNAEQTGSTLNCPTCGGQLLATEIPFEDKLEEGAKILSENVDGIDDIHSFNLIATFGDQHNITLAAGAECGNSFDHQIEAAAFLMSNIYRNTELSKEEVLATFIETFDSVVQNTNEEFGFPK